MAYSNCTGVDIFHIKVDPIIISGTNPVSQSNNTGITEPSTRVITHLLPCGVVHLSPVTT